MGHSLVSLLRFLLGVALLVALVVWLAPSPRGLLDRLEFVPIYALAGLGATIVASLVTAARWQLLAENMGGNSLPFAAYLHALVLTRFLGQLTSTLAMDLIGRGMVLRATGSNRGITHTMTQAIIERILDVLFPMCLLTWSFAVHDHIVDGTAAWSLLIGAATVVCLLSIVVIGPIVRVGIRVHSSLARMRSRGFGELPAIDVPVAVATKIAVFSVARYVTVVLQCWCWGAAASVMLSALTITATTPIAQLAGMIGITPGGLGIQEVGWAGALTWFGLDATSIGVFVLAQRSLFVANFGLLSLLTWGHHVRVTAAGFRK